MRVLTVFGTRPEAIKLAPVVRALANSSVDHAVCVTGQHREILDQVLEVFQIKPQYDLDIMTPAQSLSEVTSRVLAGVERVVQEFAPDWVIVQGDTTTAFASALAAFYNKACVAHVEAGLRTGVVYSPWPEEMNRRLVSALATLHFAPTETAKLNLISEKVAADRIDVTGNTIIDALHWAAELVATDCDLRTRFGHQFEFVAGSRRIILVTGHRRENFDGGLERVCRSLQRVAERSDVQIIYPVHPNPNVRAVARAMLADRPNVHLVDPVEYLPFVWLMQRAHIIVTDSGGIQEEAPGLGKPVLVTRDTTERPEAVAAGVARLVGTNEDDLVCALNELLDDSQAYSAMAQAKNPFGDGHAAERIVERMLQEKRV